MQNQYCVGTLQRIHNQTQRNRRIMNWLLENLPFKLSFRSVDGDLSGGERQWRFKRRRRQLE
ncbi:hypothetical protein A2U01_0058690, partial [Trifolium medium]|nr:hypothetical protein [Trifolium medium]